MSPSASRTTGPARTARRLGRRRRGPIARRAAVALLALCGLLAVQPQPASANKCGAGKVKCVAKLGAALARCHEKALKKGLDATSDPKTLACLAKAYTKFDGGSDPTRGCFAKLEAKQNPADPWTVCPTEGDTAQLEGDVDAIVTTVVQTVDPNFPVPLESRCAAGKVKCARKKLAKDLKCHQKASAKGQAVDAGCLEKVQRQFDGGENPSRGCFAKLEAKQTPAHPCPTDGDTAAVAATLDVFTEDTATTLAPPPSPGPTPGSTVTAAATTTSWTPTPSPSDSPFPSVTSPPPPTMTPVPTVTSPPPPTMTPVPTVTSPPPPTMTPVPSATSPPSPTMTPVPTATSPPSPTMTPVPSPTSPSPSVTPSTSPTASWSPSWTPTTSWTPTSSWTPSSPTWTPTPKPSVSPCSGCCDGYCAPEENSTTCPEDCGTCGDGTCNVVETSITCSSDCYCGDGLCRSDDAEDPTSCPSDCAADCGDGCCLEESEMGSCQVDCGVCGDAVCDVCETADDCCDCYCGDGLCRVEDGENPTTCSLDCYCGDGFCDLDNGEDPTSCPTDCPCGCDTGTFSCPSDPFTCLDPDAVCDGITDCPGGEDEHCAFDCQSDADCPEPLDNPAATHCEPVSGGGTGRCYDQGAVDGGVSPPTALFCFFQDDEGGGGGGGGGGAPADCTNLDLRTIFEGAAPPTKGEFIARQLKRRENGLPHRGGPKLECSGSIEWLTYTAKKVELKLKCTPKADGGGPGFFGGYLTEVTLTIEVMADCSVKVDHATPLGLTYGGDGVVKEYTEHQSITTHTGWAATADRKLDPKNPLILTATKLGEKHVQVLQGNMNARKEADNPNMWREIELYTQENGQFP